MSGTFRKAYRVLSHAEAAQVERIKTLAEELHAELHRHGAFTTPSDADRQFALARTKLEECVMWGVKAVTG